MPACVQTRLGNRGGFFVNWDVQALLISPYLFLSLPSQSFLLLYMSPLCTLSNMLETRNMHSTPPMQRNRTKSWQANMRTCSKQPYILDCLKQEWENSDGHVTTHTMYKHIITNLGQYFNNLIARTGSSTRCSKSQPVLGAPCTT
jgi:hypothetical protein